MNIYKREPKHNESMLVDIRTYEYVKQKQKHSITHTHRMHHTMLMNMPSVDSRSARENRMKFFNLRVFIKE